MDKITVDLRPNDIASVDDVIEVLLLAKAHYPKLDSVIISPSQSQAIAATDPELIDPTIRFALMHDISIKKLRWEIDHIQGTEVIVE